MTTKSIITESPSTKVPTLTSWPPMVNQVVSVSTGSVAWCSSRLLGLASSSCQRAGRGHCVPGSSSAWLTRSIHW